MKTLFVKCIAKDEQNAAILKETLLHLKELSKTEAGNIAYEVFSDEGDSLTYYVRESWNNEDALQEHLKQPHLTHFVELTKNILKEPFTATSLAALN